MAAIFKPLGSSRISILKPEEDADFLRMRGFERSGKTTE